MATDRSVTGISEAIKQGIPEFQGRSLAHRASEGTELPYCVTTHASEVPQRTSKRRYSTEERILISIFAVGAAEADVLATKVDNLLTFGDPVITGLAAIHQVARNDMTEEGNAESGEEIHQRAMTYALTVTRESARR